MILLWAAALLTALVGLGCGIGAWTGNFKFNDTATAPAAVVGVIISAALITCALRTVGAI